MGIVMLLRFDTVPRSFFIGRGKAFRRGVRKLQVISVNGVTVGQCKRAL